VRQRKIAALENHLRQVPEDARARILLGSDYAYLGRSDDALRELNLAVTLRANEASITTRLVCTANFTESRMPWMPCVKPGKRTGFRSRNGLHCSAPPDLDIDDVPDRKKSERTIDFRFMFPTMTVCTNG
jgi:hypothetical protein